MKIIRHIVLLAIALATLPALADTPIHQTRALAPDAHLSISNIAGDVVIHTWDKHQVGISGSLGFNSKLKLDGDDNNLSIKVKAKSSSLFGSNDMGSTTLRLMVPKGVNLDVDTVSARISADGLDGGTLDLHTVSGNVRLDTHNPQIEIKSVSGEITLVGTTDHLSVTTVSGDIHVQQATHEATTQSVSGDINLSGGPLQKVQMESVSGDLHFDATLAADARANLHSTSGDIELNLGKNAQIAIDANTFSGDIHSTVGTVHTPTYGPGSSLKVKTGTDSASVTLKTMSGDIKIDAGSMQMRSAH